MRRLLLQTLCLLTGCTAWAAPGKITDELLGATSGDVDVIVQYATPPTDAHHAAVSAVGGTLKLPFATMKGASYRLPAASLKTIASSAEVVRISPDRKLKRTLDYGSLAVNGNLAWRAGYNGAGIGVAVIDSGVYLHGDLLGRVVYSENFVGDYLGGDPYGHGSHVAGIIAGDGSDSNGLLANYSVKGVAPGARIINLRALDADGNGTDSAVIAAIGRAIQLKTLYNIRVINLSLGRPIFESYKTDPLCQAVEAAWKAGIVVVVAAGNSGRDDSQGTKGYGTITSPGNDPYVITVGAMKTNGTPQRADDRIASYSSKGPTAVDHVVKPDLVAPGNLVTSAQSLLSTLVTKYPSNRPDRSTYAKLMFGPSTEYFTLSGTSMAAPMVSGAAAAMIQRDPSLTPDTVKARLLRTATKSFPASSTVADGGMTYTSYYDMFTVGAGYLDVWAALNDCETVPAGWTAQSPIASANANGSVTLVSGSSVVWGTSMVWGTNVVWGTGTVSGTNVVWGTTTVSGYSVVWGTNVVWGTSQPFSEALSVNGE